MPPPRRRRRPGRPPPPPIGGRLDLHGQRTEDARIELHDFLEEARLIGEHRVLVIHGKGSGALARLVRRELDSDPTVRRHAAAPASLGGDGARIVELDLGEV